MGNSHPLVYLIDDDESVRRSIKRLLKSHSSFVPSVERDSQQEDNVRDEMEEHQ